MRTIKLTLAYDGTAYAGWQIAIDRRTLQETLEHASSRSSASGCASPPADEPTPACTPRASGQFQHRLVSDGRCAAASLNAELPRDMAVLEVRDVPAGFHARRDARSKRYRYVIRDGRSRDVFERNYAWQLPRPAGRRRMSAAPALVATHDFSSFETQGSPRPTSVRTVHALEIVRDAVDPDRFGSKSKRTDFSITWFVRSWARWWKWARRARRSWPGKVLAAADRRAAGRTAGAQGLFLLWVKYDLPSTDGGVECARARAG